MILLINSIRKLINANIYVCAQPFETKYTVFAFFVYLAVDLIAFSILIVFIL